MPERGTGSPILSTAPITPEERLTPDGEEMEEDTDLARLRCSVAIPLALFAQWTGTATANAGSIHDAQTPIGFSALFMHGIGAIRREGYWLFFVVCRCFSARSPL